MNNKSLLFSGFILMSAITAQSKVFSDIQNIEIKSDTISVVDCSESAYHPFSNPKTKHKLLSKLFKQAKGNLLVNKDSTMITLAEDTIILRKEWCYGLECGANSSNIFSARLESESIPLENGIRIGMLKSDFFLSFLGIEVHSANIVTVESCVEDLQQLFAFSNNKLIKIKISSRGVVMDNRR